MLTGAVIAPLFYVALWAAQAFTREGFRPTFHPLSLLSLGDAGWVQVLNFVITGLLLVGGSVGLRRALPAGHLARGASVLVALMGVGLVVAGLFPTDAGAGFPAGAPEGAPSMSWHGIVHEVGFVLTQLAFLAAAIVLAVYFARSERRGLMVTSIAAALVALCVVAIGDPETMAIRLLVSAAVELALISVLALGCLLAPTREEAAYDEPHGSPIGSRSHVRGTR
ncbi:DUF998 domain-containing protein [Microbacterium invictum]|uniref:DUF998 domain-containing protein n=1 Tax=Microbacterium invictum TaxID=515415 RepID=A0ABZ0VCZ4_9MICO|nr:DUF998 domain-containing protein [Microbacterium invictum]WQB71256.1 DUF998 domain-containing protein [Microbacterium invictum]